MLSNVIEIFAFRCLSIQAELDMHDHHAVGLIYSNSLLSALYFVTYFGLINCLIITIGKERVAASPIPVQFLYVRGINASRRVHFVMTT